MNLTVSGHHMVVTPSMRSYVEGKLIRVTRHFDHVIDVSVMLTVEKLRHKAEVTVRVPGRDIFCECDGEDMYGAIDLLVDKLDRQVLKHKDRIQDKTHGPARHQP